MEEGELDTVGAGQGEEEPRDDEGGEPRRDGEPQDRGTEGVVPGVVEKEAKAEASREGEKQLYGERAAPDAENQGMNNE